MGISIDREIERHRKMDFALKALRKRGWTVSVFSPGSHVNGKTLELWRVQMSQSEEGWNVTANSGTEALARMDAYAQALEYHGLEIIEPCKAQMA